MNKPFLSVVIPAHDEAQRIPQTLIDIDKKLSAAPYSYEILVIENGSSDNTADIVRKMEGTIKNLKLISLDVEKTGRSKGIAVRQGMLMAQGDYRLFMDADNSTTVDHFDRMIPYFSAPGGSAKDGGYGVVICSRALKESKLDPPQPLYRQIPGKIGNLIIQILVLPGIKDTQCGFKAFSGEAAERIFSISRITGWGFDVEILALAKKMGYRIREVPVHWVDDIRSHVKLSGYITTLVDTLKVRLWLWTNQYAIRSPILEKDK